LGVEPGVQPLDAAGAHQGVIFIQPSSAAAGERDASGVIPLIAVVVDVSFAWQFYATQPAFIPDVVDGDVIRPGVACLVAGGGVAIGDCTLQIGLTRCVVLLLGELPPIVIAVFGDPAPGIRNLSQLPCIVIGIDGGLAQGQDLLDLAAVFIVAVAGGVPVGIGDLGEVIPVVVLEPGRASLLSVGTILIPHFFICQRRIRSIFG
jgi:hypothetical protein